MKSNGRPGVSLDLDGFTNKIRFDGNPPAHSPAFAQAPAAEPK